MVKKLMGRFNRWIRNAYNSTLKSISRKNKDIDFNATARGFIEDQTDCGPKRGNDFTDAEDLDKRHIKHLAKEIDPLEGIEKVPPDSVKTIKVDISTTDKTIKNPDVNVPKVVIRPDCIKSNLIKVRTDDRVKDARDLPQFKKRIRRGK